MNSVLMQSIFLIFTLINSALSQDVSAKIKTALQKESVVPDVIDVYPTDIITVKYAAGVEVNLGNELTPAAVKVQPTAEWSAKANSTYTLAMVDPDAPSRANPTSGQIKHWLVVNIPGNQVSKGQTLAEYVGSGPPKDSGLHRYVFVVYEQQSKINQTASTDRANFKIRDFAKDNSLGQPVAVNFFVAQYQP